MGRQPPHPSPIKKIKEYSSVYEIGFFSLLFQKKHRMKNKLHFSNFTKGEIVRWSKCVSECRNCAGHSYSFVKKGIICNYFGSIHQDTYSDFALKNFFNAPFYEI